jgi:hypothetical protein
VEWLRLAENRTYYSPRLYNALVRKNLEAFADSYVGSRSYRRSMDRKFSLWSSRTIPKVSDLVEASQSHQTASLNSKFGCFACLMTILDKSKLRQSK